MNSSSENKKKLTLIALEALQYSHSPYSEKKIGSALMLSNGKIYSGCNIENASYGGTVCAERVAIFKAFSENLKKDSQIEIIAVASLEPEPWPPCGFCRQVLAEFATPNTVVILANHEGKTQEYSFAEIFPLAFKPDRLLK